ncbi:MAG: hypothetical protein WCI27_07020 [Candidatus Omnitrophota bacterium]
MTINELIQKLSAFPPDTNIVVSGYEGGFADVTGARGIRLQKDANKEWYYGRHEEANAGDQQAAKAVVITGEGRED